MQVIRYLNGKRLHGAMPPLLLDRDGVGALLGAARYRQQLPLPDTAPSAILEAEGRGLGKDQTCNTQHYICAYPLRRRRTRATRSPRRRKSWRHTAA